MKKFFILLLFSVISTGGFAQSLSGCNPNIAQQGQTIIVSISGTGTNFAGATQARLRQGSYNIHSRAVNIISNTQMTAIFPISPAAPLGNYDVTVSNSNPLLNGFSITSGGGSGSYAYLSGKVYTDANSNCSFGPGDQPVPNKIVEILPGPYFANTDSSGAYGVWVNTGNYEVILRPGNGFGNVCLGTDTIPVNAPNANDTLSGNDFPLDTIPFFDLSVTFNSGPARPGFLHFYNINVFNGGNMPFGGTLKFLRDTVPDFKYTLPSSGTSGDTLTWSTGIIQPGNFQVYRVFDSLPGNVNLLGSSLHSRAWIEGGPETDEISANDDYSRFITITGAYDPNDKQSFDEEGNALLGTVTPGDSVINYLIRFQNTGTDTAFNIYIRDTIDPLFDISSLVTTGASHNYIMSVSGEGAVEWFFPNILLEDSNRNEPGSHGFVEYRIQHDPGLPLGTSFGNTAHIYFDFNPPIVTNTTLDTIQVNVGIDDPEVFNDLRIFPNPTQGKFRLLGDLEGERNISISVVSPDGKAFPLMRERKMNGFIDQTFDFKGYASGIYYLKVSDGPASKVFKILLY